MKQTDWKIIYTKYEGITKKAIQLLSKEAGGLIIREPNVYSIYVLPCEKEGAPISKNAFFVGCYNDSPLIQKYVKEDELLQNGFLVKIIKNPADQDGRFVILTANDEQNIFYAVVSFLDDYIFEYAPMYGANHMADLIFDRPLPECSYTKAADNKTRSIFTWGHSINSYHKYIDNMARLKFNEIIIWNDYIPINIVDIIDYAHSYGIKVILGYSWGWREIGNKSLEITAEQIDNVKRIAINRFRDEYAHIPCDGIYFQSFTERKQESVGGKLISRLVVDMVNDIANAIWEIKPDTRIIFGLHATSVKNRLDEIGRVDSRMEIMWEDCGSFPYSYNSFVKDEEEYKETLRFTKEILELRGGVGVGLAFKGLMMLDWSKAVGQRGPFIMGDNSERIAEHDKLIRATAWRKYSADWMCNGDRAKEMLDFIKANKLGDVNICIAGTLDGGMFLPFALCGEMFYNCEESYNEILRRASRRSCISFD